MDFVTNIIDLTPVTKKVSVTVPQEIVSKKWNSHMTKAINQVEVKGFRKGKAPRTLVEKMHGDAIKFEVIKEAISEGLEKVYKEVKDIVGNPDIKWPSISEVFEANQPKELSFSAELGIMPTPKISGYDKININMKGEENLTDEDVQKAVNRMLDSRAELNPITDRKKVTKGDVVKLKISASAEDYTDQGEEDVYLDTNDSSSFPKEIVEKVLKSEIGAEKIQVKILADENHQVASFRGKDIYYNVTLVELLSKKLPELNEEFWESVGKSKDQSVEEFKLKIKESLENNKKEQYEGEKRNKILDEIRKKNEFEVPQSMLDEEIRNLLVQYKFFDPKKTDISQIDVSKYRQYLNESATTNIKNSIILDSICKQESIDMTDEDFNKKIDELHVKTGLDKDKIFGALASPQSKQSIRMEIMNQKLWDLLKSNTITK